MAAAGSDYVEVARVLGLTTFDAIRYLTNMPDDPDDLGQCQPCFLGWQQVNFLAHWGISWNERFLGLEVR